MPAYFTSEGVAALPPDALVALLPAPSPEDTKAMLYQAEAGQRFRMLGAYAWLRPRVGELALFATPDPVTAIADIAATESGGFHAITRAEVRRARRQMGHLRVTAVVVVTVDDRGGWLSGSAHRLYGAPSQVVGGVQSWRID